MTLFQSLLINKIAAMHLFKLLIIKLPLTLLFFVLSSTWAPAQSEIPSRLISDWNQARQSGDQLKELGQVGKIILYAKEHGIDSVHFELLRRTFEIYGAMNQPDSQQYTVKQMDLIYRNSFEEIPYFKIQLLKQESAWFKVQKRYDDAEHKLKKALSLFAYDPPNGLSDKTLTINDLSQIKYLKSELDTALVLAKQAIKLGEEGAVQSRNLSVFYNNISQLYRTYGNEILSVEYLRKSLALKEKIGDNNSIEYGISSNNLGLAYRSIGDHLKALDFFFATEKNFQKNLGNRHPFYAVSLSNISLAYNDLNQLKEAFPYSYRSLRMKEEIFEKDNFDIGVSCNLLGVLHKKAGNLDSSVYYFKRTLSAFGAQNANYPSIAANLAETYGKKQDRANQLNYLLKAHDSRKHLFGETSPTLNITYRLLGEYYAALNGYDLANLYYDSALSALEFEFEKPVSFYQQPFQLFGILKNKAKLLRQKGQTDFLRYYSSAIDFNEYLSLRSLSDRDRLFMRRQVGELIDDIMDYLTTKYENDPEASTLDSVIYFSDLGKSFLSFSSKSSVSVATDSLLKEIKHTKGILDSLRWQAQNQQDVTDQIIEYELALEYHLKNCIPCLQSITKLTPVAEIQKKLSANSLLITYHLTGQEAYIVTIGESESYLTRRKLPTAFSSWIEQLNQGYQKAVYDSLSHYLLPENPLDAYENLVIVPAGALGLVNFELLETNGQMLFSSHATAYARSLKDWLKTPRNKGQDLRFMIAMTPLFAGDGNLQNATLVRAGNQRLPGSEEEINLLEKEIGAYTIIGNGVSKKQFLNALDSFQIVHLATHALSHPSDPIFSELILQNNQRLRAYEVLDHPINAELVVLSACNTGYGKHYTGEGMMSTASAFLQSGANSVVMSLWNIPDETTPEVIVGFYKNLKLGMRKSEALRKAKLDYLQNQKNPRKKDPFFWAGFVIIGDDSPIDNTTLISFIWWIVAALGLLALGFLLRRLFVEDKRV